MSEFKYLPEEFEFDKDKIKTNAVMSDLKGLATLELAYQVKRLVDYYEGKETP